MQTIDVKSWEEFEQQLKLLEMSAGGEFLFRGQGNAPCKLDTTLERGGCVEMLFAEYYRDITLVRSQIETFTGTKWEVPEYPEISDVSKEYDKFSLRLTGGRFPAYSYMAYLRHHGFPSPLLDWSRTPYVAAFFAFRRPSKENVAIYVYSIRSDQRVSRRGLPPVPAIISRGLVRRRYIRWARTFKLIDGIFFSKVPTRFALLTARHASPMTETTNGASPCTKAYSQRTTQGKTFSGSSPYQRPSA